MSSPEIRQQGPKTDYYDQLISKAEHSFDYRAITSVAKQCIDNFPKQITEQQFQELSTKLNDKIKTATALAPETPAGKVGHWLMGLITPHTKEAAEAAVKKLEAQPKKNAEKFLEFAQKLNSLSEKTDWISNWRKGRLTKEITELTMYVLDKDTLSEEKASSDKSLLFANYPNIEQAFTRNQKATEPSPKAEKPIEKSVSFSASPKIVAAKGNHASILFDCIKAKTTANRSRDSAEKSAEDATLAFSQNNPDRVTAAASKAREAVFLARQAVSEVDLATPLLPMPEQDRNKSIEEAQSHIARAEAAALRAEALSTRGFELRQLLAEHANTSIKSASDKIIRQIADNPNNHSIEKLNLVIAELKKENPSLDAINSILAQGTDE